MGDHSELPYTPSFDWSESELLQHLADEWGMANSDHIRVIGRLRLAEPGNFGFLEDLHDAATGAKLPVVLPTFNSSLSVFVAPSDLYSFRKRWRDASFTVAEISLSPLQVRKEKNDLLACMVRPGSMTALVQVPESWGASSIDAESGPFLLGIAREFIEARLQQDTAHLTHQLEQI